MADIFISYAREDRRRAGVLVDALTRRGWTVWWDRELRHGRDFGESIQEQLDSARCVIVLWSTASLKSAHVLEEAEEGRANGRLVPAMIEPVQLPLGFRRLQAADLTDWAGDTSHDEYARFEQSIASLLGASLARTAPAERPAPPPAPAQNSRTRIITAATVTVLLAGAGAYFLKSDSSPDTGGETPVATGPAPAQPPAIVPAPEPKVTDTGGTGTSGSTTPSARASMDPPGGPAASSAKRAPASAPPVTASPVAVTDKGCGTAEDAARARPEVHATHFQLGRCYYGEGRYDEAIAAISRAIDINSRLPDYFQLRGMAKWKNGLGRQGLADLDSAIRLDVMNAGLYKSRGEIQVGVGDYQRAVDDFNKATELAPQDQTAWLALADAFRKNGDREAAEVAQRRANGQ